MFSSLLMNQQQRLAYWWPALTTGLAAWLIFITIGQTPLIRASGLGLVIVGVALTLRRLGAVYAITGGLALAFSPAFWLQTGGGESAGPATIVVAVIAAGVVAVLLAWLGDRPYLGIGIGLVVFTVIFWSQIGTPRSLRLTSFVTAWLLYVLINIIRLTNPRPDEPGLGIIDRRYPIGLLLLLAIGVINDPLFLLFVPAVVLGLYLSRISLPWWYWAIIVALVVLGLKGVAEQYVDTTWWNFPVDEAESLNLQVPFILIEGWRESSRWVGLLGLVINQFTIAGLVLGVMGLSRLSRWYPTLGVVTMIAYAPYAIFGLVYFGQDRDILLLPLLIIQIIWITYAVYALGQWLQKSVTAPNVLVSWLAPIVFALMPLVLLLRIVNVIE